MNFHLHEPVKKETIQKGCPINYYVLTFEHKMAREQLSSVG